MSDYSFDGPLPLPVGSIDLEERASTLGIRFFLSSVTSLDVGTRAPLIPASAIRKVQTSGHNVHGFLDFNYLGNQPECYALPDPRSLIQCPWNKELGWLACFLFYKNKPSEQCPRRCLVKQIQRAKEKGLKFKCGTELEFNVLHPNKAEGLHQENV